jgi:hypothetical protein
LRKNVSFGSAASENRCARYVVRRGEGNFDRTLLLALERRRIAHPKLRTTPIFKVGLQQGFAVGEMVFNDQLALQKILNGPCPLWVLAVL